MNPGSTEPREIRYRLLFAGFVLVLFLLLVWQAERYMDVRLPRTLVLYCFSALDDVMENGILPEFKAHWLDSEGEEVEFITTFAGSGTITDRILRKFPAEVAILSSELDALQLSRSGIFVYARQRRELPGEGIFAWSPFVIFVRPGNPHAIADFSNLATPGIELLHADPRTSGGGQWAILSVYGSVLVRFGPEEAKETLAGVWQNVTRQPASARALRELFEQGVGDVMITYEQQVLSHPGRSAPAGEIVVPSSTILGEHVVVKLEKNIQDQQRELVDAFVEFLWSRRVQEILVKYGFRSVEDELNATNPFFSNIEQPFTLADLGGAREAKERIIEDLWQGQILKQSRNSGSSD